MTAGEAWTRELLAELRANRYRASAWRVFFHSSFARARTTRERRTREHRQLRLLAAIGLTGWAASGAGGHPWLAVAGAVWLLLLLWMVDWHLGMLEDDFGRPLHGLGAANLLTLARGALVPAVLATPLPIVAALFAVAGASDVVDGRLARARQQESRLGRFLDGGVDACVLAAVAISAARLELLPWWAVAVVLARHTLQWSAIAIVYFIGVPAVRPVSARLPGLVLYCGLALALLRMPFADELVVLGGLAGTGAVVLAMVRTVRVEAAPA